MSTRKICYRLALPSLSVEVAALKSDFYGLISFPSVYPIGGRNAMFHIMPFFQGRIEWKERVRLVQGGSDLSSVVQESLNGFHWKWFCSISFPPVESVGMMERWVGKFYGLLFRYSKQSLGANGFYFRRPVSHCHILLTNGKRGVDTLFADEWVGGAHSLAFSDKYARLQAKWARMTQGYSADIREVESMDGLSQYIAGSRNAGKHLQECEVLKPLNVRLLKRRRTKSVPFHLPENQCLQSVM